MKAVIRYKGGKGSGFRGHAGRPGFVGGSASGGLNIDNLPVETVKVGNTFIVPVNLVGHSVSPGTFRNVVRIFDTYPDWMKSDVKSIELRTEIGYNFTAGGNNFQSGANYNNGNIKLFDSELYISNVNVSQYLDHEVGHAIADKWWRDANHEEGEAYDLHPEWFEKHTGMLLPEYANNLPLTTAQDKFLGAWKAGEDGISDYSKAWAKEGKWSETIAEMTNLYNMLGTTANKRRAFKDACVGAGTLADAYLAMVDYYESQEKGK